MRAQGEGLRRSPTRLAARQTDRLTDWRTDWLSLSDSSGQLYEYEAYLNIKPNRTELNRTKSNPNRIRLVLSRVWLNWAALSVRCDPWPLWATVSHCVGGAIFDSRVYDLPKKNFLKTQPKVKDQVQELRSKYHFTHLFFAKSFACAGAARSAKIQRSPFLLPPPLSWAIKQQFAQWVFGFFLMILVVGFAALECPKMTWSICCQSS